MNRPNTTDLHANIFKTIIAELTRKYLTNTSYYYKSAKLDLYTYKPNQKNNGTFNDNNAKQQMKKILFLENIVRRFSEDSNKELLKIDCIERTEREIDR